MEGKHGQMEYKRPMMRKWTGCVGGKIMPNTHGRVKFIPDREVKVWKREFVPIKDIDGYLRALKNSGTSPEELNSIREMHERDIDTPQVKYVYKPETSPQRPVKAKLRVKGEKVKLSIRIPYDEVLDYCRDAKPVPFETMIKCMKMNGAENEFLIEQINRHDKNKLSKKKDDQKFLDVFEKYTVKKTKPLKAVKKMDPIF